MTRLTKQKSKLEELLADINAFKAKGKAAEIGVLLDKYTPAVEQRKMNSWNSLWMKPLRKAL